MPVTRAMRIAAIVGFVAVAAPAIARGDPAPWAVGVSDAKKATAKIALDAGNAMFVDRKYTEALAKYREAIAAWDHPAIRFNIVRCLIQLDRILEASDNLERALAYGAAPLEDAVYAEALSYDKLIAKQIGELAVACTQPGVALTLDGKPLATCPATERRRVEPGAHQVVAVKSGFVTRTIDLRIVGGTTETVRVELEPATATRVVHRWPTWIPWLVFGGGLAVAGVGALVDLDAASDMAAYNRVVDQECGDVACAPEQLAPYDDLRASAERKSQIAVGVIVAGGATLAVGAAMLYLNRGRTVVVGERMTAVATPVRGGAVVSLVGAF